MKHPVTLIILDGWGHSIDPDSPVNVANTPCMDGLASKYGVHLLEASSTAVGLPDGQAGNSEAGHSVMGLGRVIESDLIKINRSIAQDTFKDRSVFAEMFDHVHKNGSRLHVVGLMSEGGVHSHLNHVFAFLALAKKSGIEEVFIHAFTDGRDTPPCSAIEGIRKLQNYCDEIGVGKIVTMAGRFYAMDRDGQWDRVDAVVDMMFENGGTQMNASIEDVLQKQYDGTCFDEYIPPVSLGDVSARPWIQKNDGVFFVNIRADRARMLAKRIAENAQKLNLYFASMVHYDDEIPSHVVFPLEIFSPTFPELVHKAGLRQVYIAETEKRAHVSYFMHGGREEPFDTEQFVVVPSLGARMYSQKPEMSVAQVANEACSAIKSGADLVVVNIANPDMVGHTGDYEASVKAVQYTDTAVAKIFAAVEAVGGVAVITADHGNVEEVRQVEDESEKHTAHTASVVPCIITDKTVSPKGSSIASIGTVVLELLGIDIPSEMQ